MHRAKYEATLTALPSLMVNPAWYTGQGPHENRSIRNSLRCSYNPAIDLGPPRLGGPVRS